MTKKAAHRVQGLLLVFTGLSLIAVLAWRLASPILDLHIRHQEVLERMATFRAAAVKPITKQIMDASGLLSSGDSIDEIARRNQRILVERAQEKGLQLLRMTQSDSIAVGRYIARIDYLGELTGDLRAIDDYLEWIAQQQPTLFIRRLELEASDRERPDTSISVTIVISSYFDLETNG